jgi:GAF domain-containing protein
VSVPHLRRGGSGGALGLTPQRVRWSIPSETAPPTANAGAAASGCYARVRCGSAGSASPSRRPARCIAGQTNAQRVIRGSNPLGETFCQRMLDGRIGNYVRDASADARVNDLAMARHLGVRAWLGVPIKVSEMRLYALCCLVNESRPSLGDREVRLLLGLAESIRVELQARTDR